MELLNLSFKITMDFNATNCSTDVRAQSFCFLFHTVPGVPHSILQLFQHYLFMLSGVGIFESQFHSTIDIELGQSIMRILLAAISHSDKEVGVISCDARCLSGSALHLPHSVLCECCSEAGSAGVSLPAASGRLRVPPGPPGQAPPDHQGQQL